MTHSALARPTRRTLVRGAAWSVPVVSLAAMAPAFAASPCASIVGYALDWGNTARTTYSPPTGTAPTRVGTATALAPAGSGAGPVIVTFTSTYVTNNNTDRRATDNLTVPATTNIGGLGASMQALLISHASTSNTRDGFRQEVAVHFDRPVSNLTFTITDTDSKTGSWWDRIELTGTRTGTYAGAILEGAGVLADPWRAISSNNPIPTNAGDGNVAIAFAAPVTDIALTFWSAVSGGNQIIRLTDFAFDAKGC